MLQAFRRASVGIVCLLTLALFAFAQSDNSSISGIVKDPSGAAVANAKVSVVNESTNFERLVKTNESGFYTATNISPGYYTVKVEAPGFKTASTTRIKLEAALPLQMNVDLSVGQ